MSLLDLAPAAVARLPAVAEGVQQLSPPPPPPPPVSGPPSRALPPLPLLLPGAAPAAQRQWCAGNHLDGKRGVPTQKLKK